MVGEVKVFAGITAPTAHVFCNGQLLPVALFPELFSVIGNTFGGDGVIDFAVPDLRGRVVKGANTPTNLNTPSGSNTALLSVDNLPPHKHNVVLEVNTDIAITNEGGGNVLGQGGNIFNTSPVEPGEELGGVKETSVGQGTAFSVENPNIKLNYIIQVM